ncbi:hypothetical protein [Sphingomonas colocasiae]|uniref:Uncharacterized protein n=1 Tax=Sphingomonas colocasiae TaxID=1848973 RepID=A0ABS7PZP7_9SPHN|nr:hypothetical protein [Sphingomonas colocasiae]MBY8826125.1 hypothetical protein [Sphingomonas colocasiae]
MFRRILLSVTVLFGTAGCDQLAQKQLSDIQKQVAEDAVKQYEIVRNSGTAVDKCVHAGLVAASYLQAQDESNYQHWKAIEAGNCAAAGVPR